MTLENFLDENMGKVAKIGSGTAFIFCDTIDDSTKDDIFEMSNREKIYRDNNLADLKNQFDTFDDRWADTMEDLIKTYKKNLPKMRKREREVAKKEGRDPFIFKTIDEYEEELVQIGRNKKESIGRRIAYETAYLNNWKDFLSRLVKDVYDSFDEEGAKICIFDGDEHGKWWTSKEYRTGEIDHGKGAPSYDYTEV